MIVFPIILFTHHFPTRNFDDYANLDTISVDANSAKQFVVKVTVPTTGISNAQSDTILIKTVSQGTPAVYTNLQLDTQTPLFGNRVVRLDNKAFIH